MKLTEQEYQAVLAKYGTGKGRVTRHTDRPTPRRGTPRNGSEAGTPAPSPTFDSKEEADYARHLALRKHAADIIDYVYHPFTFLLPGGVRFTPDFLVIDEPVGNGPPCYQFEIHEYKGSLKMRNARDGVTRFKIAKGLFPWMHFKLISRVKGQWTQVG